MVDLVNRLESEARAGRQGRLADYLTRLDFVVLDELGYLPFAQTGGQLLFHLISRLYERTSVVVTTNLSLRRVAERVRRRQDDDRAPRSADPSLRDHRDRKRKLALQAPRLTVTPACPGGQTGTSRAALRQTRGSHSAPRGSLLFATGTTLNTAPRGVLIGL